MRFIYFFGIFFNFHCFSQIPVCKNGILGFGIEYDLRLSNFTTNSFGINTLYIHNMKKKWISNVHSISTGISLTNAPKKNEQLYLNYCYMHYFREPKKIGQIIGLSSSYYLQINDQSLEHGIKIGFVWFSTVNLYYNLGYYRSALKNTYQFNSGIGVRINLNLLAFTHMKIV